MLGDKLMNYGFHH